MADAKVIVSLRSDREVDLDKIARNLKKLGMHVEEKLPILRRITGTIDETKLNDLTEVSGVKNARKEKIFKVA
jgi:hypothetical protein